MSTAPHDRRSAGLTDPVRLGLIGDNIKRSRSPDLHRLAGRLSGLDVSYDLFIPRGLGKDFDAVFDACRDAGLRGINLSIQGDGGLQAVHTRRPDQTHRFGQHSGVRPAWRAGYNTDHRGFVAAYRAVFDDMAPGKVVEDRASLNARRDRAQEGSAMKILIVDDHPKRYDRLIAAFGGIGVAREQIDLVGCANAAREKIEQHLYDLLILDILLPLWPEADVSVQHSADLLFEIREKELPNPPPPHSRHHRRSRNCRFRAGGI
ncbi:hypothetical protein [Mesorhizobium sp. WSM3626]|uniref:hypothetical protein n=1 Tax=Mesorhizobium sp. WSM3626 TaxID=1040987 RepID=UPI00068733CA|nr:hypothetical protein [Mesorhizobium sp. WSM3626]